MKIVIYSCCYGEILKNLFELYNINNVYFLNGIYQKNLFHIIQ